MVLVFYRLANYVSFLQTKLRHREGYETRRVGLAVYLHTADKSPRLPHRPSKGQKDLYERVLLASQRPSEPWGSPRRRPCGHTDPASTHGNPSLPLLRSLPHTPAGCGHGGTRKSSTSRRVHTWSVSPAAIAGVHDRHRLAEPVPCVASGTSNGWRTLAWGKQKLE